jgi:predicted MFS family arabinose efflux permease
MQDQPAAGLNRAAWWVWLGSPIGTAVLALGVTQIIAWGTTLYALGVLGIPIAKDTGWSRSLVFAGLTVALLASGAVSAWVGRLIDGRGARSVMSLGSVLAAAALTMIAVAPHPTVYLAGWALLGPAMRMNLYDAAFAALVQVTPSRGRRAISYLTLFGGFASTVFWPIGHVLNGAIGWRMTFLVYAAINLAICLPLHWWGLARRDAAAIEAPTASVHASATGSRLEGSARRMAMLLFAVVTSASAFVFGAMAVHLPAVLQASGLSAGAAVTLASVKGVAQVAGRVGEIAFGHRLHAIDLGRFSVALMPISFVVLMAGGASLAAALAFIVTFGVANGLVTIVRGAVPLALFGPKGYGTVLGILATPYLIVNALAPAAFAVVIDLWGYRSAEALVLAAGLLSALSMEVMAGWYRRRKRSGRP